MVGIERGQGEESKLGDSGEWCRVSERSKRSMIGLTVLAALELGILDSGTEDVHGSRKGMNEPLFGDGQMVCIRLEHLRVLWERNDRTHWDQTSRYSECSERPWEEEGRDHLGYTKLYSDSELRAKVQRLQWQMVFYRHEVSRQVRNQITKAKTGLILVTLMNRLNYKRVHKEFAQYPRTFKRGEVRESKRWRYWKERWRQVILHAIRTWVLRRPTKVPLLPKDAFWKDQIRRHPWYRCIPLVTWLATWEVGLVYLPTSSRKESWRDWPNPEVSVGISTDIAENDRVWRDWSEKCGHLMRTKDIGFYEDEYIDTWWSHLRIINKREVLRWLLYDRSDYRWHHSTGAWMYYLGKIPGLRNQEPRTILHSRERPSYYEPTVAQRTDEFSSRPDWSQPGQEIARIQTYCAQSWPQIPLRGLGCGSLGIRTWVTISKEDALEEQRTLCERIARHRIGEHRDGRFSRADSVYITSPYACQEWNLPLFPDHEASMALTGTGEPGRGRYIVRIVNPGLSLKEGKKLESTWLSMGLTSALMQMNPPGFISGPSQSSEVTYSQPREDACVQSQMRLVLRDLSRAHDVQQGIAVAKKYENMPKLLGPEVLNQIGPLNHPTP